ncbi:MAG: alpha-amylase family glycosyl hydrolase, partial [Flavobacteriaceae bacterium]|nr:alpha-amylase family glycosyl hydrolase [Flavobacteriaceae bacterium]
ETAVIYEANIRQYSKEGTFKAFTKDIPVLKELGVKVIWLMPINPISVIKRKATDGSFTSEIEDIEERKKYLGSYYSVSDYKAINPEFGNKDDFKALIDTAHDNGMYVIVDWVPNHTGWDHPWITAHPEWYTQNEQGEIIDPINPDTGKSWGWTDTADLNYDNLDMQQEMIKDLKYWVENFDIDGYRMDVAHKVPPVFFKEAIAELKKIKPIFMLAEAEQHELFRNGFDMQYAWEGHHVLNSIAKGDATVSDFDTYMEKQNEVLEASDFTMNFVTNHDENSWSGTVKERMGDASEILTTLVYAMPGMPLIYSGQEYDLNHRLKFFEKDSIPKTKGNTWNLLTKLGDLKNNHLAFHGGKIAASYERLSTENENVVAFKRSKEEAQVYFIGNLSNQVQSFILDVEGTYEDLLLNKSLILNQKKIQLAPWQYYLLNKVSP